MNILTRTAAAMATLAAALSFNVPAAHAATPTCFGRTATIVGTAGPDNLNSQGSVSDVIVGLGGNDTIDGGYNYYESEVPDYICGGGGDDSIYGSAGGDHVNAGAGNDFVDAGMGPDVVDGGAGADKLRDESCGSGCDYSMDVMRGQGGNDILEGGYFSKLYGGGGADDLIDWECDASYLNGGAGDDYFESYKSNEAGQTCDVTAQDGVTILPGPADTVIGGADLDRAVLSHADKTSGLERITYAQPDYCSYCTG